MARYFLDTSALIKRYVNDEPGHQWIASLCAPDAAHTILIADITLVEMVATFCRMARETPPRLNTEDRDALIALFRDHDVAQSYVVVPLRRTLLERAAALCRTHPLRAYDAIQLACALQVSDDAATVGGDAVIFICADLHLLTAALAEGMATENPNERT